MKKKLKIRPVKEAWRRDGYESRIHYLADKRKFAMRLALEGNIVDHPYYEDALEARKLNLI